MDSCRCELMHLVSTLRCVLLVGFARQRPWSLTSTWAGLREVQDGRANGESTLLPSRVSELLSPAQRLPSHA